MSDAQLVLIAGIAAFAVFFLAALLVWLRRTAKQRALRRRIKAASHAWHSDVFLPDGLDGYIHIDHLLLADDKILVLDIKNPQGAIFGAPRMDEWTVIDRRGRHGFRNPLGPLSERTGAVKALIPGVAVEGRVVFLDGGEFPKGVPPDVLTVDQLPAITGKPSDKLHAAWDRLQDAMSEAAGAMQARD